MPDHLLDVHAEGEALLPVVVIRVVTVPHGQGADTLLRALSVLVQFDTTMDRYPVMSKLVLEAEADRGSLRRYRALARPSLVFMRIVSGRSGSRSNHITD